MASLTIRKLDEGVKSRLRVRAAHRGHSMEEEAREILSAAVAEESLSKREGVGTAIRRIVAPLGGVELDIPPRLAEREPPDFSE